MSKSEQSTLILAITILILFVLNYFVTLPTVESYNENVERVSELDLELLELERDIAQGEALAQAIKDANSDIRTIGVDEYFDENYSIHNFFVDFAEDFNLDVTALSMSEAGVLNSSLTEAGIATIAGNELVSGYMTNEEINVITPYYEVLSQNSSLSVEGTIEDILDYADFLAKENIYMVFPSLTLSDFIDNNDEVSMTISFVEYSYRVATVDLTSQIVFS